MFKIKINKNFIIQNLYIAYISSTQDELSLRKPTML